MGLEFPYQTFERLTGLAWPGGRSLAIQVLLVIYNIPYAPGTAEANLALQGALLATRGKVVEP